MAEARVYIETSIPSFYCASRTDPEALARKNWTQHWWDFKRAEYELVTSIAVLDELNRWPSPARHHALALLRDVRILPAELPVIEIVRTYVAHQLMPADPVGDALHLAIASYYKCDFLLTWNCRHLANANKFTHIRRVNVMLGLFVPALVTPLELLEEEA